MTSSLEACSAATDGGDQLNRVAFAQCRCVVLAPRNDFLVDFDRDTPIGQLQVLDQTGHAERIGNIGDFSVESDLHGVVAGWGWA